MRFESLFIAGCGRWLPKAMTIDAAERAGLCDRRLIWRTEITSVCQAEGESAPEMAVLAAEPALRQSGCEPAEIDLVLHASGYYQGHDLWPAASYIQRAVIGNRCPAMEVRQMSNGGMAAMELAASYLVADQQRKHALITTGDRFCLPGYDRWRSDPGTICGDGGTAMVLSKDRGLARLLSLVTVSDPSLEKMTRGNDPFGTVPFSVRQPIDLGAQRQDFVAEIGLDAILDRIDTGQREVVGKALHEAGTELCAIGWFVIPGLGRGRVKAHFLDPLGIDLERTTWPWARTVGHLGAGDQIAGLSHLADSGCLTEGQKCLVLGVGAGFSWSAAVIEVLGRP